MSEVGEASKCYFYFDFRNTSKQHLHDLIPSLLTQLSARSGGTFYHILVRVMTMERNSFVIEGCWLQMRSGGRRGGANRRFGTLARGWERPSQP